MSDLPEGFVQPRGKTRVYGPQRDIGVGGRTKRDLLREKIVIMKPGYRYISYQNLRKEGIYVVKDPERSARGRAIWASKTEDEKKEILGKLAAGRAKRAAQLASRTLTDKQRKAREAYQRRKAAGKIKPRVKRVHPVLGPHTEYPTHDPAGIEYTEADIQRMYNLTKPSKPSSAGPSKYAVTAEQSAILDNFRPKGKKKGKGLYVSGRNYR